MMIERNEFRIKFGKMKEAKAIWIEICKLFHQDTKDAKIRMMTDLTGPSYTLVVESELRDFIHIGLRTYQWMTNSRISAPYQQFIELCNSAERTLYHIEYQV